ncbi:hypothetical protein PWT90_08232 [Aphanocladium album]|nr:hypothetical protein PWT90_08232 [Aphanocladium album]
MNRTAHITVSAYQLFKKCSKIVKAFVVLAGAVSALPTGDGPNTAASETCSVNSASHCCYDTSQTGAKGAVTIVPKFGHCYPVQVPVAAGAVQGGDACKGGQAACCGPQSGLVALGCAVPVAL